jgi:sugar/nucleoside kinase (ribokinase family)
MSAPGGKSIIVLGDVMTDIIVKVEDPVRFGSDTWAHCSTMAGGSGANQAAWLAECGLQVHFVGCVGDDSFGRAHLQAFASAGISAHCATLQQTSTGMIIVLVQANGDRTMITDRGANSGLALTHLPREIFKTRDWFHLSGYTLLDPQTRDTGLAALQLARDLGMHISVDPSSTAPLVEAGPQRFLEWTRGADLCFPNLDEGGLLTGETDEEAIAAALCRWYGGVALKLGRRGALWASAASGPAIAQPAEPVQVVDTTGAGDAFCAGFLAGWLTGATPNSALAQAIHLAATAAGTVGGRPPGSDWLV